MKFLRAIAFDLVSLAIVAQAQAKRIDALAPETLQVLRSAGCNTQALTIFSQP